MNADWYRRIALWKDVPREQWETYRWQMTHRIETVEQLRQGIAHLPAFQLQLAGFAAGAPCTPTLALSIPRGILRTFQNHRVSRGSRDTRRWQSHDPPFAERT